MSGGLPLFSVIVPTFNRANLLIGTLTSVFAQRFADFEVIVVDDGSTDATVNYLQSLGKRVTVFRQTNRGAGAARNLGAGYAKGKYLAFLDSDDMWFPWTLEVYEKIAREYHEPAFLTGKPYVFSNEADLDGVVVSEPQAEPFSDYLASGDKWRWWGASSFVIRRDAFEAAGRFTEEWVNDEDTDLTLRMGVAPGFVHITSPVTFAFREHPGSVSKDHARLLAGTWSRVRAERRGRYPGGQARRRDRRRILTRHIRPVALGCLQRGLLREAWKLYFGTFTWNASLLRLKYLTAFPFLASAYYLCAVFAASDFGPTSVGSSDRRIGDAQ